MAKKTYEKGQKLQQEFAYFLKAELQWEKVSIETPVTGAINSQGTKVDIIAERLDKRGERLKKLAIFYLIICGFLLASGFTYGFTYNWDNDIALMLVIIAVFLEVGGFVALFLSIKYNKENAWIECKNHDTKTNKDQIRKMLDEYNDYVKSRDRKYKIKKLYFASGSGYIKNAIEYADHHGVECYVKIGEKKFEKVKFWD